MPPNNGFDSTYEIKPLLIPEDHDDLVNLFMVTMQTDPLWAAGCAAVDDEAKFKFLKDVFLAVPVHQRAFKLFKTVEKATGKMVGWCCIRLAQEPDEAELKAATVKEAELAPEGWRREFLVYVASRVRSAPADYGYDKAKHIRRFGLFVHPDYHRRGIARRMSEAMADIANAQGKTTYVCARPKATALFLQQGFTKLCEIEFDYRSLGVDRDPDCSTVLMKLPEGVAA